MTSGSDISIPPRVVERCHVQERCSETKLKQFKARQFCRYNEESEVSEIYYLIGKVHDRLLPGMELLDDDLRIAIFTMTDIAVLMDAPLDEVQELVKGHYQTSLEDKRAGIGIWEDPTAEHKALRLAVARGRNRGVMDDDEILDFVRVTLEECERFRRIATMPRPKARPDLNLVKPVSVDDPSRLRD